MNMLKKRLAGIFFHFSQRKFHIWFLVGAFFIAYFHLAVIRHWHFESNGYDLGIFDQAIWKYSQFIQPYVTVHGKHILGEHFHPILIGIVPFYWLFQRVEVLLLFQALALSIAALPVYLFSKKRVGHIPALLLSASYLLFWGVQLANNYDFHEVSIAVPFIAIAIYAADSKKWSWYYLAVALMLLTKENMSILLVGIAAWLITQKSYLHALYSFIGGSVWFYATLHYVIPKFSGSTYGFWYYSKLGADAGEALKTMFTSPFRVLEVLVDNHIKRETLTMLLKPFLFLVFLSPLVLVIIPLIFERLLSDTENLWTANYHYNATIAPVLAMACADSVMRIGSFTKDMKIRNYFILGLTVLIACYGLFITFQKKYPLSAYRHPRRLHLFSLTENQQIGRKALLSIPEGASVSAQDPIIPHLSHREEIYELTLRKTTDYYIRGGQLNVWPLRDEAEIDEIFTQRINEGYEKIFDQSGWVVLKRP